MSASETSPESAAVARKRVRPFPFAELPRMARTQVEAGRVLLSHLPLSAGPDFADACRALGGPIEIELVEAYALPARELAAQARGALCRLVAPGGRWALLAIDPQLAPRLARRALGTDEPDAGGPELGAPRPLTSSEEGALEFLVGALVEGSPLRLDGVLRSAELAALIATLDGEGWLYALSARVRSPVGVGFARLFAPESLRLAFAAPGSPEALYARRDRLADARVALPLEVGRAQLARADLAALEPHDVVILDRVGVRDARGGPVSLCLGRGSFRARLDGEALIIEEPFRLNLGAPMTESESPKSPDAQTPGALLGELPVEVVCELGRVTMSGRELCELRPGAVVPVGRPLAGPVDLTVGGRVVARGELVDVEGELGVRVTQLCD
jgi:flagellar motor switch protein FliM